MANRSGATEYAVERSAVSENNYESPLARDYDTTAPVHGGRVSQESVAAPVEVGQEPVKAQLVPVEAPEIEAREREVNEAPARSQKWWVDESETTVGGPSFLGLSNADASGSGGYSYLLQEEEERSHKWTWALLLMLVVLAGVLYARWQPIRDFVLTTALTHARPQRPATQESNAQEPIPASSAPTTTMASSDAQAPPITTETKADQAKTEQNKTGQSKAADTKASDTSDTKEGLPEGGKQSADDSSKASTKPAAKQPEKEQAAARDEAPADDEDASAADEEKAPATQKARATQVNEGGELVNSGERYLYGRGVPRSCDQAVSYFNAAAAKQNPQAFSHLGALYATGECVPMDRAMAYAWFRRAYAKEPANHYFEQNLSMLWREMTSDEKQRATGRQ